MDLWLLLAIPFLVFLSPRVIKSIVPFLLYYRRRFDKTALKNQIKSYREELTRISQVDEFARYSKVQRRLRASSDQLDSISREDLELNFKCVLVVQGIAWLLAVILSSRLVYQIYFAVAAYTGLTAYEERNYL